LAEGHIHPHVVELSEHGLRPKRRFHFFQMRNFKMRERGTSRVQQRYLYVTP
jgi:hypothetical protein